MKYLLFMYRIKHLAKIKSTNYPFVIIQYINYTLYVKYLQKIPSVYTNKNILKNYRKIC